MANSKGKKMQVMLLLAAIIFETYVIPVVLGI